MPPSGLISRPYLRYRAIQYSMATRFLIVWLPFCAHVLCASPPPLVCSSGTPLGSVDLRVVSPLTGTKPLPLRTINRLEKGETLTYSPILQPGEDRKGDVAMVLVPFDRTAAGENMAILGPKPANKPAQWKIPWRVSLVAFVYGAAGLNRNNVRRFLSRDDELVGQLADYADKTARTEALIAAISSSARSDEAFQAAAQGFSSKFGIAVQVSPTAPTAAQASALFTAINPDLASYDPLSSPGALPEGVALRLATSIGELFYGSPVGLAAGGTALLVELGTLAFPRTEFRASLSQPLPEDGLGLCGKAGSLPAHTRVAYLWATRVSNAGPPVLSIGKANSLPTSVKSPLPVVASAADWKYVDRARDWTLQPDSGKPAPVKVQKLGDTRKLELDLGKDVKPGRYRLEANWDWGHFEAKGFLEVRTVADFKTARFLPASQDRLVARTGKVPVTLENSDFEFVTKVEIERLHDEFATPSALPFVLPQELRAGPQNRMDVQIDTTNLDPGSYQLKIYQLDGKASLVDLEMLTAPPTIVNLPLILNQGVSTGAFLLKGQRLELLKRIEVASGSVDLAAASPGQVERGLTLRMAPEISAGTSFAIKAFIEGRSDPLMFSDGVRIAGPAPNITEVVVSKPPDQKVQLDDGELPGGVYLSAMLSVEHLRSNSLVKLGCDQEADGEATLRLGERSGPLRAQQLTPNQVFLSFDTGAWRNGCILKASIANSGEGESAPHQLGKLVLVPDIEGFELADSAGGDFMRASLTGQNLETIEKIGWTADRGEPVGLPLPVGDGQKQQLQTRIDAPPDPDAGLFLWLRNETKARVTTVRPGLASH